MSKEVKLGAFALVVLAFFIWGYTFLKGKNLLTKSFTFKTAYNDVTQLTKSSPVYINGYKVGSVLDISLNPTNLQEMIVTFDIENDFKIPVDATAQLINDGFVGGKSVSIKFDHQCTGSDCAQDGHMFKGKILGLIGSMVGADEVEEYTKIFKTQLNDLITNLGSPEGQGALNKSLLELEKTMTNMSKITEQTNAILAQSSQNLNKTMANLASITTNLSSSNAQITTMVNNLTETSSQLKNANIGNTITSTTATVEEAKMVMTKLQSTLEGTDKVMKNLDDLLIKASTGDGTLAKLLNDQALYANLENTSKNLSLLLQDLRLNPSRYVKVSVFGGKNKDEYTKPENDPAFNDN